MKKMIAKFPGKCAESNKKIQKGDTILYSIESKQAFCMESQTAKTFELGGDFKPESVAGKYSVLIGLSFDWHSTEDGSLICKNQFTVKSVSEKTNKYFREYPDGTGENMPLDSLLYNIERGKFKTSCGTNIREILKGRKLVEVEKSMERQLSYYENYGTIHQGKRW
jgi:hypothetical protein